MDCIDKEDAICEIVKLKGIDGETVEMCVNAIRNCPVVIEIKSPQENKEEKQVQGAISGMLDRIAAFDATMEVIAENTNIEYRHIAADAVMCDLLEVLGFGRGVNLFRNMERWYS